MKPRDWFTVFLRVLGIWELMTAVDTGVTVFNVSAQFYRLQRTEIQAYVTHTLAAFLMTAWLLKGAPSIAKFFYPEAPLEPVPTQPPLP